MNLAYPECRYDYSYGIGDLAEQLIKGFLRLEGFKFSSHKVHDNGVDICLEWENTAIEIWNWKDTHCYESRFQSVVENLKPYKYKFLVTSFISPETKSRLEMFYKENPIVVIELGFQSLPKKYEEFYANRGATKGRKFVSRRTMKVCRNRLAPLFNVLEKKDNCPTGSGAYVYTTSHNTSYLLRNSTPSFYNAIIPQYQNRDRSTKPGQNENALPRSNRKTREYTTGKIIEVLYLVDQILKCLKANIQTRSFRFHISRIEVLDRVRKQYAKN